MVECNWLQPFVIKFVSDLWLVCFFLVFTNIHTNRADRMLLKLALNTYTSTQPKSIVRTNQINTKFVFDSNI